MPQKYMSLIDTPSDMDGVLTPEPGTSAMEGEGDISYRCGACKTRLIDNVTHDQVCGTFSAVQCPKCKRFNELPPEDQHHHHH